MRQNGAVAVALLLLSIGSGVNGFSKARHPVILHEGTSLSPLRVTSTTWATSNDSGSNEQRQRQKAKAPLVDSTLLRFLSSQKNSGPVLLEDDRPPAPVIAGEGSTISITSPINGDSRGSSSSSSVVDLPTFTSENLIDQAELEQTFASSTAPITDDNNNTLEQQQPGNKVIENQTWLSQYNAQRVTLKLLSLGVENEAATKAGRIVQNYALARVTRRRIRKFLQERDAAWESGSTAPLVDRTGIKESISALAAEKFDIDGVISVMTDYGLTGTDVAAIFSHTPSIAMMQARSTVDELAIGTNGEANGAAVRTPVSLEQTLERAFVNLLGQRLKLRRYDARKVLRTCPGLLTSKGSKSANQVVNLMVSLGSSTNSLARDKSTLPTLLSRSPALIFRLVAFLTSAQLKLPLNSIGPILRQKQSAEMLNAVAPLKRTISLGENTNNGQQQTMLDSTNNITSFNVEEGVREYLRVDNTLRQQKIDESYRSMEAVADVLRRSAGIRDFRKILSSYPDAFFLNVTNIHHVASYLREDVGMTKDEVSKAIQNFPSLLKEDVTRIKDVVDYLRWIEVDEEDLPSIIRSFPATLLLDIEKDMVPVVDFIRGIGVRNIGRFVTRLPPVLGYSVEKDLQPKWDFLTEVCQFDYFEVARFPAYFSYPLDRVIKLRYEYLRDVKGIPIQLARVDDVLRFGDREFATEIALDDDYGVAFAKFAEERNFGLHSPVRKNRRKPRRKHR